MTMYINATGMKYRDFYSYIQSVIALERETDAYSKYPNMRIEKEIQELEKEMKAYGIRDVGVFEEE